MAQGNAYSYFEKCYIEKRCLSSSFWVVDSVYAMHTAPPKTQLQGKAFFF